MKTKIGLGILKKFIRESLLREAKCPSCGSDDAYVGFSAIECPNKRCMHYSPAQAQQATSTKTTSGGKATSVLLALADRIRTSDPSARADDEPYVNDNGEPHEIDDLFGGAVDSRGLLPDGKLYNPFITDNAGPIFATDIDDKTIIFVNDYGELESISASDLDGIDKIEDLYDEMEISIHPSYHHNP